MGTGSPSIDRRAIELGCHPECLGKNADAVAWLHPDCWMAVMHAFDEVYGNLPPDLVRLRMVLDGLHPY